MVNILKHYFLISVLFRLPFRRLVSMYGCDITYTPMIYANCFVASERCREVEFGATDRKSKERPIAQFAANNPEDFAAAAEIIYGYGLVVFLFFTFSDTW